MMQVCFTISNYKYYHKNKYSKHSIMELIKLLSFVPKGRDDTLYREFFKRILRKLSLEEKDKDMGVFYIETFKL